MIFKYLLRAGVRDVRPVRKHKDKKQKKGERKLRLKFPLLHYIGFKQLTRTNHKLISKLRVYVNFYCHI